MRRIKVKINDMNGIRVQPDDPGRAVWWANCGYWTDDWDALKSAGGIPVCPECGCPGFFATADQFLGSALEEYDKRNPGYAEFLKRSKGVCMKAVGGIVEAFRASLRSEKK